jgi:hypothetical protein
MKERIVEKRNTKYGQRIVKHIKGKVIIEKIRKVKIEKEEKKPRRKKTTKKRTK